MLDGSGDGELWAKRAAELGMPALALTDHGTLAGQLEHIEGCHKAGIMPVNGLEAYFRDNRLEKPTKESKRFHLTLLAMNYKGWISLQRLSSEAYATGFAQVQGIGYKPHVDWDLLARHKEGIYCVSGCYGGMLSYHIQVGYEPDVVNHVQKMRSIFGENFSIEIQHHDFDGQRDMNIAAYRVAYETGTPLTACGDPHYPFQEWGNMNDTMFMLATKTSNLKREKKEAQGDDIYTMKQDNPTLYLMDGAQKAEAYAKYHPNLPASVVEAAIKNSGEVVSRFVPFMLDRSIKMPPLTRRIISKIDNWHESATAGETREQLESVDDELVKNTLRKWAYEGLDKLKEKYPADHWERHPVATYEAQLAHEFDTFDQIGIHVWRYMTMAAGEIRWARDNGVIVGPGRGSAAGSLVAYTTGITGIDPISYGLIFERFINPNRKGMPDIDIDFMPGPLGRDKVKQHTAEVYGEDNVVDIAAFGTYGPRKAIQDVCRVFDDEITFLEGEKVRKAIDLKATDKADLEECAKRFDEVARFKDLYPTLFEMAQRIEGAPYSASRHASGVLIKPSGIEIATAFKINKDSGEAEKITAWPDTRELLAAFGWLKLDMLVIEGLARQHSMITKIEQTTGKKIDLEAFSICFDPLATDKTVMEQFHRAATLGVWQMDGKSTVPVLKSIKPDNMHDLSAINALIRPGPRKAGMTEQYAKLKHGQIPVTYWHDAVEPVLKNTYGLMIYQEQAMEICVLLGGFTRTEADDLRKAMGKKYREGIEAVRKFLIDLGYADKFINNASKIVGEEVAMRIWEFILAFGEYSFNASHSYAYSIISYIDMWLKTASPALFYAELLTGTSAKLMPERLSAALREGAKYGLRIKNPDINRSEREFKVLDNKTILYGIGNVKHVGPVGVEAIFQNRPFRDYPDFVEKVPARACNKNAKKALIGVGAFDEFGMRVLMTEAECASNEEAYLGLRITGKSDLERYSTLLEETVHTEHEIESAPHGAFACIGGEVTNIKAIRTKNGDPMAFLSLAFGTDVYRATMFPDSWARFGNEIKTGKIFLLEGVKQVDEKYGDNFIVSNVISAEELAAARASDALDASF